MHHLDSQGGTDFGNRQIWRLLVFSGVFLTATLTATDSHPTATHFPHL
jgi:hypothetical protein